jgi:hypothetical protein
MRRQLALNSGMVSLQGAVMSSQKRRKPCERPKIPGRSR